MTRYCRLRDQEVGLEIAKRIRDDQVRAALAIALAAAAVGSTAGRVASGARDPKAALARQVAMYLVHTSYGISLGRVAAAFGRDRSTVAHACRAVEERRDEPAFDRWLDALETSASGAPVAT